MSVLAKAYHGVKPVDRLNNGELRVLAALLWLQQNCGRPPTLREISSRAGLKGTYHTHCCLHRLRAKGLIEFDDLKKRTWQSRCRVEIYQREGEHVE